MGNSVKREEKSELFLVFSLSTERYGLQLDQICELTKYRNIVTPKTDAENILGSVGLGEYLVDVIDLHKCMGLDSSELSSRARIIYVEIKNYLVGLLVDNVIGVVNLLDSKCDINFRTIDLAEIFEGEKLTVAAIT